MPAAAQARRGRLARPQDRPRLLRLLRGDPLNRGGDRGFPETPQRIDVALAIAIRAGRILVARRPADRHQGDTWEFPGGKVDAGEDPAAAARRELREETGLAGGRLEPLLVFVHDYADRPLRLHAYLVWEPEGDVWLDERRDWTWAAPAMLRDLTMPPANRQILRALAWRLGPPS